MTKKIVKPKLLPVIEPEATLPRWFSEELLVPFKAAIASVFLVHGDIGCLVRNQDAASEPDLPFISLRQYLEKMFEGRPMVVFYNIASGLEFLTPAMEQEFKRLAGLSEDPADTDATDPVAAARADLRAKRDLPREPEACLPLLEKVLKTVAGAAVVIQSVHFIAPTTGGLRAALSPNERMNIERLKNWAQHEDISEQRNIVLLLTDEAAKVSNELRASNCGIPLVFIPKPNRDERRLFIESLVKETAKAKKNRQRLKELQSQASKASGTKAKTIAQEIARCQAAIADATMFQLDGYQPASFVHATQGMSLRQILEMFLRAKAEGGSVNLQYIKQKKREILNREFGDLLELVEAERGLDDIGGLEHLKKYFREVLEYIQAGETRLVPMGVTLTGPPGTGKTALVEALAKEAGFNFVKTKNIRSMWVGDSEARMERLLYALRALAPVVVMNDEADLGEANRDAPKGDSGVSERLMQQWMTFLSDPRIRGQILVINCTNRPDRLDAALKRSGRSDDRILVPMPGQTERAAIFPVMFKRHRIDTSIKDFGSFAKNTEGLSGADLENIVRNSARFARQRRSTKVDEASLQAAIRDFIPSANQAEIDRMTLFGLLENSSRQLLPNDVQKIVQDIVSRGLVDGGDGLIEQLKARKIV